MVATANEAVFRTQLIQLYELYRDCSMNMRYYGYRLKCARGLNTVLQTVVAIGTSATLGGLVAGTFSIGKVGWALASIIATTVAVLTPFLKLEERITRLNRLHCTYSEMFYEADLMLKLLQRNQAIPERTAFDIDNLQSRYARLGAEDDPAPNQWLLKKCQTAVNRAIPPDSLWLPEENA